MCDTRVRIYYDGTCRLCSGLIERIECSSEGTRFESIPIQREVPPGLNFAAADRDVHAIDAEGHLYAGVDAVRYILSRYPAGRRIAWVLALPGVQQLARVLYRAIADHRKQWFPARDQRPR